MKSLIKKIKHSYVSELVRAFVRFKSIDNKSSKLYVKELGIKGKGLFTKASFKKGELVFIAPGATRVAHFEGDNCYLYPDWYSVDEDTWIDITYPFVKINHSCSPNTGIFSDRKSVV